MKSLWTGLSHPDIISAIAQGRSTGTSGPHGPDLTLKLTRCCKPDQWSMQDAGWILPNPDFNSDTIILSISRHCSIIRTSRLTSEQGHFLLPVELCVWNHYTDCSTVKDLVMACRTQWDIDTLCPGHQHQPRTLLIHLTYLTVLKNRSITVIHNVV